MTYFPNPSTFTSEPNPQYIPSIQTSPSLSSARLGGSISQSSLSLSSEAEGDTVSRTPRVTGAGSGPAGPAPVTNELQLQQQQQQFYYPQPAASSYRADTVPLATSPRMGSTSTRRSASVASNRRPQVVAPGYGSTGQHSVPLGTSVGNVVDALGLGGTVTSSGVDPRRIASTSIITNSNKPRRTESPAVPALSIPTNMYASSRSQPPSAITTPRFRKTEEAMLFPLSGGSRGGRASMRPGHRRQKSANSALPPVTQIQTPTSPSGSVFNKLRSKASGIGISLGRTPSRYDDDSDFDYDDGEDDGKLANGTRVWYSSYVTIDWLHDAIKESSRIRRLRHLAKRSWRGAMMNMWDRSQGWLIATVVGILTAVVAFLIIRSEMAFFDLKEGYCTRSWGTAKRFCCTPVGRHSAPSRGDEELCEDWMEWGQRFGGEDPESSFWSQPEFIAYFIIATSIACISSALTYYLTSSAHHVTSKDSAFLGPTSDSRFADSPDSTGKTPTGRQELLHSESSPLLNSDGASASSDPDPPMPQPPRPVIYMAAGSGIPEIKTILSGFVIHGYLGMSTLVVKSVGLAMSVGSGLSLGKEGPFVHIASCIANIVSRAFAKYDHNEGKRREILSAACAAGVAVSFGAPIGGVLFSLEEVSYYFPPKVMWRSFWCAAVAAITLRALNPYGNGSIVLFAVTYTKDYRYWEYSIFIVLGIFGGLYGALFSRLNIIWSREVRKGTWLARHPIFEVFLVTALTTFVGFLNPYTRLGGTELVAKLFSECTTDSPSSLCVSTGYDIGPVVSAIGMALLIKATLTIITFGVVLPAGIFIPSLVIGACFGRIVGIYMEWIEFNYPSLPIFDACRLSADACVVPGIYAMVGAAATLAGVTRTTVSLAVIMFELTGSLNYVAPVMVAVLVAKSVADALEKRGIYELVIELKRLPYLSNKDEYLWGGRLVSEVVSAVCELTDTRWTRTRQRCAQTRQSLSGN